MSDRLTEEEILRMVKAGLEGPVESNEVGIGDDAALLPNLQNVLVTTDLLIENVHFLRDRISPFELGYKSLAVNLSDIAAMGGTPRIAFLSLAFPKNLSKTWLQEWISGFQSLAKLHGVRVFGGDTTASPGPIVINVLLTGEASKQGPKLRSMARPGDCIYVSAFLGDSKAGLQILQNPEIQNLPGALGEKLVKRHHQPKPFVVEGTWLGDRSDVTSMMDISDGLWKDLNRLAEQSQVGFEVDLQNLPISPELQEFALQRGQNPKEIALAGGEDYVLLWTVQPETAPVFEKDFRQGLGFSPYRIGSITEATQGRKFLEAGAEFRGALDVFEHF